MDIKTGAAPWYNSGVAIKPIYIVVHYTANNGDTAKGNCCYFHNNAVKTGAHFFVDENDVYRSTPEGRLANHCGGKLQGSGGHTFYGKCKNGNSLGVELCSRKDAAGKYYFKEGTLKNAAELVKYLMSKYGIPADRVIRHYDVTGKICPAPLVEEAAWKSFKARLGAGTLAAAVSENKPAGYVVQVTADSLNLRTGPGTSYPVSQVLKKGDRVRIVGNNGKWLQSNYNKWLHGGYVKTV